MSMIETVTLWNEGVGQLDSGQAGQALSTFSRIKQPSSKIFYNMGCCHCRMGQLQQAIQYMTAAIEKDQHLAVAYMCRGTLLYQLNRSSEALSDFTQCLQKLRGKHVVDYGQLGMRYKLFACEPLYNLGVVSAKAGDGAKALQYLTEAAESPTETRHASIFNGVSLLKAQNLGQLSLWALPNDAVFRPPRSKVANLGKKDYLGKAQVVSSNQSRTKQPEKLDSSEDKPSVPSPRLLRLPAEGHPKGQRSRSWDRSQAAEGHSGLASSSIGRDVQRGTGWLGRPVASSRSQDSIARVTPPTSRKLPSPAGSRSELTAKKQPTVLRPAPPPPQLNKQFSQKKPGEFGNSRDEDRPSISQKMSGTSSSTKKPTPPPKPAVITTQMLTNKPTHFSESHIPQQQKQVPPWPPNKVPVDKVSLIGSSERGRPPPPDKVVPRAPVRTIP